MGSTTTAVGVHKAEAVREALLLIGPMMDVSVRVHRLAGQESALSAAATLKEIASCDLLIDATANPEVFLHLAAIAKLKRRPLCWAELFAGGFGGLVARARPDLDPNPLAVRTAIQSYYETLPTAPHQDAAGYDIENPNPMIADDAEVTQIASALTRIALDAMLKRVPSTFPCAAYLVGLRKEWVFLQPFDTLPIDVSGEGWDDVLDPVSDTDRLEGLSLLLGMLPRAQNDNTDPSA